MPQINIRSWRIVNTIVLGIGLLTPWIRFELDAYSIPFRSTPGWQLIWGIWRDILISGIAFDMWPLWLLGFSGILLILYAMLNLYLITKDVNQKGNKLYSFILLGVAGVLLFHALIGDQPMLGYWFINLGIFSSAILEWIRADMNLHKGK